MANRGTLVEHSGVFHAKIYKEKEKELHISFGSMKVHNKQSCQENNRLAIPQCCGTYYKDGNN